MAFRFGSDYAEDIELLDGRRVRLRPIRSTDKALLAAGFRRLSPQSRYRRFLSTRQDLTERELRYLTELDGIDHFAICATRPGTNGAEEGIGVARFIRLPDQPSVAEPAVTILDDWQHQGLGTILLERLAEAAAERGVERFRARVLGSNAPIRALLDELGTAASTRYEGEQLVVEVALADALSAAGTERSSPLGRLLGAIARATPQPRI